MTIRIYAKGKMMLALIDAQVVIMFRPKGYKIKTVGDGLSERQAMKVLREEGWKRQCTHTVAAPNPLDGWIDALMRPAPMDGWWAGMLGGAIVGRQEPDILDAEILE